MTFRAISRRFALMAFIFILMVFSRASTWAASVTLAWDPSPTPTVSGYEILYGLASDDLPGSIDAGTNTSFTVSDLTPGLTYYFAVSPYDTNDTESPISNEISFSIPLASGYTGTFE